MVELLEFWRFISIFIKKSAIILLIFKVNKYFFTSKKPLPPEKYQNIEFVDETTGTNIPDNFIPAIKKVIFRLCYKKKILKKKQNN